MDNKSCVYRPSYEVGSRAKKTIKYRFLTRGNENKEHTEPSRRRRKDATIFSEVSMTVKRLVRDCFFAKCFVHI